MVKVLSLVGDLAILPPPLPADDPVLDSPLARWKPPLRCGEAASGDTSPARIINMLPVAGGRETRDPDVDPGLATGRQQWIRRHIIAGQHQHPAVGLPV